MKKVFKRIAAVGAAMVMAVSMMGVGASAVSYKEYALHNTPMASSGDNVSSQTLTFSTTQAQKYTVSTTVTSKLNTDVKVHGYVWRNNTWNLVVYTTNAQTQKGSWYQISSGLSSKNVASITTSSSYSTNGYGKTKGY